VAGSVALVAAAAAGAVSARSIEPISQPYHPAPGHGYGFLTDRAFARKVALREDEPRSARRAAPETLKSSHSPRRALRRRPRRPGGPGAEDGVADEQEEMRASQTPRTRQSNRLQALRAETLALRRESEKPVTLDAATNLRSAALVHVSTRSLSPTKLSLHEELGFEVPPSLALATQDLER
jgi:hypothetical protein